MIKMKVFPAAIWFLAWGWALPIHARLAETPQQLQARYGEAISTVQVKQFTRCQYEKLGFQVDVYFLEGKSVVESFAKRGLSPEEAEMLVAKVAGAQAPAASPEAEQRIRRLAGLAQKNLFFWSWSAGNATCATVAVFNPVECTAIFFSDPAMYARLHRTLASSP